jgi:hypothetical protein
MVNISENSLNNILVVYKNKMKYFIQGYHLRTIENLWVGGNIMISTLHTDKGLEI